MYRFIESICLYNGVIPLLEEHQERMLYTLKQFYPGTNHDLIELLQEYKVSFPSGKYKIRIVYDRNIIDIGISPYQIQIPEELLTFDIADRTYSFKFEDRNWINKYKKRISQDQIPIFIKNGHLTDAVYHNLVLFDEKEKLWVTPDTPLLAGVQRAHLLKMGSIFEKSIKINQLEQYSKIGLINGMIGLGELILPINSITINH